MALEPVTLRDAISDKCERLQLLLLECKASMLRAYARNLYDDASAGQSFTQVADLIQRINKEVERGHGT